MKIPVIVVFVVAGALAAPAKLDNLPPTSHSVLTDGTPYQFSYQIYEPATGLKLGARQGKSLNPEGVVTFGEYNVMLPDGRVQVVKFTSDSINGYQADVTYLQHHG